ncbi:MAG: hypothetical protein JY451_11030 [Erythrobacter sp.]|nr:MAG: hypothetical protein JY451_11030 [Erythrobacter sp.]
MKWLAALISALCLPLAACNQNSALGNDREAQLDPAPTPAPVVGAAAALENVANPVIKPETMSTADIAALGGLEGKCAIRLTEVAHPSFVFEAGASGAIKLNGKIIPLPAIGSNQFGEDNLTVTLSPTSDVGDAGLSGMDMVLVLPGSEDELGYAGFVDCSLGEGQ